MCCCVSDSGEEINKKKQKNQRREGMQENFIERIAPAAGSRFMD
jgi:hypothetical protein